MSAGNTTSDQPKWVFPKPDWEAVRARQQREIEEISRQPRRSSEEAYAQYRRGEEAAKRVQAQRRAQRS